VKKAMSPAEKVASGKPPRKEPPRRTVWRSRLREVRRSLGLTLADVARATGLCFMSVQRAEAGKDLPLTRAKALAAFFGTAVEDLWPARADEGEVQP
jgi:DNA-binding XRE family transcriptional regulator